MNRALVIATIALVAVVMVMSVAAPAMAGNHANVPPDDPPCDAIDNPSDAKSGGNAEKGKGKAKPAAGCP